MEPAYFVSQFSHSVLSTLIKQCFGSDFRDIETKAQVRTIVAQLNELGASTIICEREYIDRDYSDDYANYYVQSFKDYKGSCARLHFFSNEFEHEDFDALLTGDVSELTADVLRQGYLGFVVVKPLPFTFLGRSCIATISTEDISRTYKANLFGIDLSVKAVAFQEQDRVVSACATTAVWSLLHALPDLHKTQIPSPSAITLAAIGSPNQNINSFPNKGLNLVQVTSALEVLRLKQHSYQIKTFNEQEQIYLRKFTQCYIDSKIPIFIGARIFKLVSDDIACSKKYVAHGDHAVVVTGLREKDGCYDLIMHDDRIGPYLKMELVKVLQRSGNVLELADGDTENSEHGYAFQLAGSDEIFVPTAALVATYPKKKIGVEPIIRTADFLLKSFKNFYIPTCGLPPTITGLTEEIEYKVQLLDCKDLKSEYLVFLTDVKERNVLLAHLPRFIWRVQFVLANEPVLDMLFDATDTPNGNPFIQLVRRDKIFADFLIRGFEEIGAQLRSTGGLGFEDLYTAINEGSLYSYHVDVLRRLAPIAQTYHSYLAETYGSLRSPKYVRSAEASVWPPQVAFKDSLDRHRIFSQEMAAEIDLNTAFNGLVSTEKKFAIWVIDAEGALVFGPDSGHPTLTDANPARIAGELHKCDCGTNFLLNAKSGRYSGQYPEVKKRFFLEQAVKKWSHLFPFLDFVVHPFPDEIGFLELKRS